MLTIMQIVGDGGKGPVLPATLPPPSFTPMSELGARRKSLCHFLPSVQLLGSPGSQTAGRVTGPIQQNYK